MLTGFEIASYVYVGEMGAERFRKLGLVVLMTGWSLGQIFFPVLLALLGDWRIVLFIMGGSLIIVTFMGFRFIGESPRYLVTMKRY